MYIIKSKGPRIDPWGTPCFTDPQFEKKFWVSDDFILVFCIYYPPIYTLVFRKVSSFKAFQPKFRTYFSYPPYALHARPLHPSWFITLIALGE
jgi:hypothetical protein